MTNDFFFFDKTSPSPSPTSPSSPSSSTYLISIGAGPSTYTTQLIKRQLTDLMKAPPEGISVGPKDDNLFLWEVLMVGPPGTLYEGGFFKATLKFYFVVGRIS